MINDKLYFDSLGVDISKCATLEEALKVSKLDYIVEKKNIYLENNTIIKDKFATVKNTNGAVLGIVGKDYTILNNIDGFDFVDDLVMKYKMKFIKAGHYEKDENSFIILKMEYTSEIEVYIFISNSYGGSGSVMTMLTPVFNKSVIMLKDYKTLIRHSKNVKDKPVICEELIAVYNCILNDLENSIHKYKQKMFTSSQFRNILNKLTGLNKELSNIKRERAEKTVDEIMTRYYSQELQKEPENLWRAILSVSGQECQRDTLRDTNNPEIFLNRIITGMPLLTQFIREVK